jgi:hypothetical protein
VSAGTGAMTELDRYLRLEAVGLWREAPDAQPREVIVSFGKSTLLLTDLKERPLAHWPLGGIRVLPETDVAGATVYAMSDGETLGIRDPDMVAAIAAIRRAQPTLQRQRRRRRRSWRRILAVLALVLLVAAGPPFVRGMTMDLIPPEQEAELGERMLSAIIAMQGPPCDNPDGMSALEKLSWAVDSPDRPHAQVMELGDARAVALPGDILLIDRAKIETEPQNRIAGLLYGTSSGTTLRDVVRDAGIVANFRYIRSGHFDDAAVARAAAAALLKPISSGTRGEYDLTDADWAAIRGICR